MMSEEDNKLIAEFMDVQVRMNMMGEESYRPDKYWECLMPVVEKIEHTSAYINIKGCHVKISTSAIDLGKLLWVDVNAPTKLEAVYKAVVKFIRWYNENKYEL